jgi:GntR family transcriptional repressor for pyruvate dehydrogenase complex
MDKTARDGVFKEIGGKTIVDQIVDNITNAIISGEIKPGDKIPTEAELCQSMNVGRNSVREAIKILVAYGVLKIKRADGTFVRQEFNKRMLYPLLYGIILQKDFTGQIIELRKIVDVGLLELVMDKVDDEFLKQADQALKELEKTSKKPGVTAKDMFEADVRFHKVLVDVTQNKLLEGISYYVDKITQPSRTLACEKFLQDKAIDKFLAKHEEIVRLLKERDRKAINGAINNHYQYWVSTKGESFKESQTARKDK